MQSLSRLSLPRNRSTYQHPTSSRFVYSYRPTSRAWEFFNMAEYFTYAAKLERDPILRAAHIAAGKAAVYTSRRIRLAA